MGAAVARDAIGEGATADPAALDSGASLRTPQSCPARPPAPLSAPNPLYDILPRFGDANMRERSTVGTFSASRFMEMKMFCTTLAGKFTCVAKRARFSGWRTGCAMGPLACGLWHGAAHPPSAVPLSRCTCRRYRGRLCRADVPTHPGWSTACGTRAPITRPPHSSCRGPRRALRQQPPRSRTPGSPRRTLR
jgi:hypothetical protein